MPIHCSSKAAPPTSDLKTHFWAASKRVMDRFYLLHCLSKLLILLMLFEKNERKSAYPPGGGNPWGVSFCTTSGAGSGSQCRPGSCLARKFPARLSDQPKLSGPGEPQPQGAKFVGVQGSYPSDCGLAGVGGVGGVDHGILVKSKKSSRSGCAASRAVRCAELPMKRFSTNLMMAV